jgi:hypothetical protein
MWIDAIGASSVGYGLIAFGIALKTGLIETATPA